VTSTPLPASDLMLHGITAAQRLTRALARHGLAVPHLRGSYPVRDRGQVDLGSCPAETADAIAALLEQLTPQ
jgi:hypothetical protein